MGPAKGDNRRFLARLLQGLSGFGAPEHDQNDCLRPFFLGLIEFATYPVLMVTGNWSFIGAWLMFKTLAQWKTWAEHRDVFNRFLIGNALVIILSLMWVAPGVRREEKPAKEPPPQRVILIETGTR